MQSIAEPSSPCRSVSHPPVLLTHLYLHREVRDLSNAELLKELVGVELPQDVPTGSLGHWFGNDCKSLHARKCHVAKELVTRWLRESLSDRVLFADPRAVRDYLMHYFAGRQYESFVVMFLDAPNRLIDIEDMFRGTLSQTSVYPREIVKAALQKNAASVVFAHNHPSGVATPSRADEALTQTLKAALSMVDVRVLDHFVVAPPNCVSFAETGLL